jgi:UDP-perosamine 4-acetyltransferase
MWRGIEILGNDEIAATFDSQTVSLVNALGQLPGKTRRFELFLQWQARGFRFNDLIHPSAVCATDSRLCGGVQIMAGVVLQPDVEIGENSIINTGALIDHDCRVGKHVHIAPGAILCGGVTLADHVFIGAGAVIGPGVTVHSHAIVGANVTLLKNLAQGQIFTVSGPVVKQ